jgi:putative MATE family efflux protein
MSDKTRTKEITGIYDGPLLPVIIKLALPIYLGSLSQILYNIVDGFWVGLIDKSNPSYLGSIGIIFPIYFVIVGMSQGVIAGTSSLVARAIGEKNKKVLNTTAESALFIAVCMSILLSAFLYFFLPQIIALLGAKGEYYTHSKDYLTYLAPIGPLLFLTVVFVGILQGEGLMVYVMISMMTGFVINIIIDPVFIFTFHLKVKGAAIASCISQLISLLFVISVFVRKKNRIDIEWKWKNIDYKTILNIIKVGVPRALTQFILALSFIIFNKIIIDIHKDYVTAFSIYGRFEYIIYSPMIALAVAVLTIVGQNAGRGNLIRIKKCYFTALGAVSAVTIFLVVVFIVTGPFIFSQFSDVNEIVGISVLLTRAASFSLVFVAVTIIAQSLFLAVGHGVPAFLISFSRLFIMIVPLIIVNVYIFEMGIKGFIIGVVAGNFISAAIVWIWTLSFLRRLEAGRIKVAKTG